MRIVPPMSTHTYPADALVAVGVAATILGVSVSTVRRWEAAGLLAAQRTLGGQRRYLVADLLAASGRAA